MLCSSSFRMLLKIGVRFRVLCGFRTGGFCELCDGVFGRQRGGGGGFGAWGGRGFGS